MYYTLWGILNDCAKIKSCSGQQFLSNYSCCTTCSTICAAARTRILNSWFNNWRHQYQELLEIDTYEASSVFYLVDCILVMSYMWVQTRWSPSPSEGNNQGCCDFVQWILSVCQSVVHGPLPQSLRLWKSLVYNRREPGRTRDSKRRKVETRTQQKPLWSRSISPVFKRQQTDNDQYSRISRMLVRWLSRREFTNFSYNNKTQVFKLFTIERQNNM